ncbi:DUF1330 domain-containing protein [Mucilaginibacter endophyticus]|uniref:DUF1330 domain-containing protein n=1 Tax=Mucilaginibacter endophyticus TaxID=2675003 RepID=UPI000E0CD036|nr:DUF1330 domain-containing protein [Mucilaginibacter endophyticus]
MGAYIIFIKEKTLDQAQLDTYSSLLPSAAEGFNFKPLTAYGQKKVVEGPEVEGVVVLEFPSFQEAEDFYNSPRYTEVKQHRFKGAVYTAVIVEGFKQPA